MLIPQQKGFYGVDNGSEITGESVIDRIHPDFRKRYSIEFIH
jgi:hypothetical protein